MESFYVKQAKGPPTPLPPLPFPPPPSPPPLYAYTCTWFTVPP